jgi:uncharacterized small protein (DUF1192 family)
MEDTKDIRYRYLLNRLGEVVKNYEDNIAGIQLEILALRDDSESRIASLQESVNGLTAELNEARNTLASLTSPPVAPVPVTEV